MKIELAGYNVDKSLLPKNTTPETLTAAYARISRSPKTIELLRKQAIKDIEKTRKSNETIIYDYGHKSISEHAVFNFDISGISRLALEELERSRIASYTEKSQRYVKFKNNDYIIPEELKHHKNKIEHFINDTHSNYHRIYDLINKKRPDGSKPEEDARYVSTLSVLGQVGLTINASSLECMIKRLKQSPLRECQSIAEQLYIQTKKIAPSLIKHVDKITPRDYLYIKKVPQQINACKLLYCSGTDNIIGGMLQFENSVNKYQEQDFSFNFENLSKWDAPPRAFEMVDCVFEVVLSAAAFAQMKRHRTFSIISQQYNPSLGYTIPPAITGKALDIFTGTINASTKLYYELQEYGEAAQYVLTQAHRKRAIIKANLRALYNFSRLREDIHAQWDIRNIAKSMISLVKQQLPETTKGVGGKSEWK